MADLLPSSATPIERAVVHAGDARRDAVHVDAIREAQRPGACPSPLLPWLAWAHDAPWPRHATEAERRAHISTSLRRHRLKGTLAGLQWAARDADAEIVRVVTPPAKQFVDRSSTPAERAEFLARFPELRIHRYRTGGRRGRVSFAVGHAQRFLIQSDAALRIMSRATLIRDGVSTELDTIERRLATSTVEVATITQVAAPSTAGRAAFVARHPRWPAVSDAGKRIYTMRVAGTGFDAVETTHRSTTSPGLDPLDVRPEHIAERGHIDSMIPGLAFVGARTAKNAASGCLVQSSARERLYQRLRLFDPAVAVHARGAGRFIGQGVLGMPAHHARVDVRITGRMDVARWAGPYVRGYVVKRDQTALADAIDYMRDAARVSDRIALSTITRREIRAGEQHSSGAAIAGAIIER